MHTAVPTDITPQLSSACTVLKQHLAETLQAIHLFGSSIEGGLKPHSDIDLLVTVNAPLAKPVQHLLVADLLPISTWPVNHHGLRPLEVTVVVQDMVVPWQHPAWREFQFGEWLRAELEKGIIQPPCADHDLAILLANVRQHSVCLWGPSATELFDPIPKDDLLKAFWATACQWHEDIHWQGDERNVVLTLARIWFSVSTGQFAAKNIAAQWALERLPQEHHDILASAQASYLGNIADDLDNSSLQVAAFIRFMRATIKAALSASMPNA